jgi:dinuclear metal center YbgI/SA1388 family protein
MAGLQKIVSYLNDYLKIGEISDHSFNGLQFEGKSEVKKIIFAVDCGIETFKRAVEEKADMVVVHHGLFWNGTNPSINGYLKERLDLLYKNKISLYAAHLPLDRHNIVGNNAQLIKLLGGKIKSGFAFHEGKNIGWIGEFPNPVSVSKIEGVLNKGLKTKCITLPFGKKEIKTIAVCSGGPGYETFFEALNSGADAYLAGEPREIYHNAKDAKFNVFFAGHHATETLGVKALSEVIRKKFAVKAVFVDIPTGL